MADFIEPPPWHTEDWDTGSFDGEAVPGLMSFVPKRGPKWDRKPVAGQTGETQTFKGWNNAEFKIEIRTWTDAQYRDFLARILPIIEPEPGKEAPKEIALDHPVSRARKIETFKIDNVEGPKAEFDKGYVVWTIDAFQSLKKVPQKGTGKPGETPCQKAKRGYDESWAKFNVAQVAFARGEDISGNATRMEDARIQMDYFANFMNVNGCSQESPGSQAVSNGPPTPPEDLRN